MLKRLFLLGFALLPLACGGSSGPSTPKDLCSELDSVACDKVFQCVPAAAQDQTFVDMFGTSVSDCKSKIAADCANATCVSYNASLGQTCINKFSGETCADIGNQNLPAECDQACTQ
jgi:hypothetical protein